MYCGFFFTYIAVCIASLLLLHMRLQTKNALGCVQTLEEYCGKYKEEGEEFKTLINGVLPDGWADELPTFTPEDKPLATRLHSQTMLNALAPTLPGFWGGSAGKLPVPLAVPLHCLPVLSWWALSVLQCQLAGRVRIELVHMTALPCSTLIPCPTWAECICGIDVIY